MWRISDRLHQLFQLLIACAVKHKRQQNRQREAGKQHVEAEYDCVFQNDGEHRHREKSIEIFEPCPWTVHNAQMRLKIFESNRDAIHWQIVKNNN